MNFFFFSSRRRHTRLQGDWSSDVCSSDLSRSRRSSRARRRSLRASLAWLLLRSRGPRHDERRGQVVVVDDDARTLPGPALTKVEVLALAVTLRVLLGLPSEAMVPVPLDPDKDREVPAAAQLRPMEEDAVEEQDRSGGRPLLGRLDRDV